MKDNKTYQGVFKKLWLEHKHILLQGSFYK